MIIGFRIVASVKWVNSDFVACYDPRTDAIFFIFLWSSQAILRLDRLSPMQYRHRIRTLSD